MADVAKLNIQVNTNGVVRSEREVRKLGTTAKGASGQIKGLVAGFAGLAAARSVVTTIAAFEETFAQVRGIVGSTAKESVNLGKVFGDLEEQARSLGATTRFSATEAAEAQLFLARAGLTSSQILKELPATLNLASAGMLQLGEAADIASNVLSTFSKQGLDLAKIGDTLVGTANRANTDVRQLGEAFVYVGATAAALGQDIDEMSAILGVFGNSGIQGSLAGTTLNATMGALLKPTSAAKRVFKELGDQLDLTAKDFVPSADRSLIDILATIDKANLSVSELANVFGRTQATRGALIGIENVELIRDLNVEIGKARGEAEALAKIQEDTLAGAFRSLKSAVQEAFLQVGEDGLTGGLRGLVDSATDVLRVLTGFEDQVKGSLEQAQRFASVVKGLGVALAALGVLKLLSAFAPLVVAIRAATGGFAALNAVMAANPIGFIVSAVAALVLAYDQLKDNTIQVGDSTVKVSDVVTGVWYAVRDSVVALFKILGDLAGYVSDSLPGAFEQAKRLVSEKFKALTDFIGEDWVRVFQVIFESTKTVTNKVIAVLVGLSKSVATIFGRIFDFFKAFGEFDLDKPFESAKKVRDGLAAALDIRSVVKEISDDWSEAWDTDYVGKALSLAVTTGKDIAKTLSEAVGDFSVSGLIGGIDNALGVSDSIKKAREERLREERKIAEARREAKAAAESLESTERGLAETRKELQARTKSVTEAQVEAINSYNEMRREIELQIKLVGKSSEEAERFQMQLRLQALALEAAAGDTEQYNAMLGELNALLGDLDTARAFDDLSKGVAEAEDKLRGYLEAVNEEIKLVGLTREEREIAIARREVEALATIAQTEESKRLGAEYVARLVELQKLEKQAERTGKTLSGAFAEAFSDENLDRVGESLAGAFTDATRDILNNVKSVEDALKDLAQSAISIFQEAFIFDPLKQALSGAFGGGGLLGGIFGGGSAQGNAFGATGIVPLAKGGILSEPTFATNSGTTFLAGEAGPEAVVPLARDASGNLGIRSNGGGAKVIEDKRQISVRLILPNVRDAKGFSASRGQIAENLRGIFNGIS